MAVSTTLALALFSSVSTLSPGPNNVMVFASGMNFGLRRTIPHLLGIWIGFGTLVFCAGFGMLSLIELYPHLELIMMAIATVYLLYLAYKIAMSTPEIPVNHQDDSEDVVSKNTQPMTFTQATLFQWINPKAWFISLSIATMYFKNASALMTLFLSVVVVVSCMPSGVLWTFMGTQAKRFVNPNMWSFINKVLAVLLVLTMLPVIIDTFKPLFVS